MREWAVWIEGQWGQYGKDLLKENSIKLGALIGIDHRKIEQTDVSRRKRGHQSPAQEIVCFRD